MKDTPSRPLEYRFLRVTKLSRALIHVSKKFSRLLLFPLIFNRGNSEAKNFVITAGLRSL